MAILLSARCHRDDSDKVALSVRYKFVDTSNIQKDNDLNLDVWIFRIARIKQTGNLS